MPKKIEVRLRLTESEYDALCRFASENGKLSLNAAGKLLISYARRGLIPSGGNKVGTTTCVN